MLRTRQIPDLLHILTLCILSVAWFPFSCGSSFEVNCRTRRLPVSTVRPSNGTRTGLNSKGLTSSWRSCSARSRIQNIHALKIVPPRTYYGYTACPAVALGQSPCRVPGSHDRETGPISSRQSQWYITPLETTQSRLQAGKSNVRNTSHAYVSWRRSRTQTVGTTKSRQA